MEKDVDGINDEYEEYEEDDDSTASPLDLSDETLDSPLEYALDLSAGEFDLFKKSDSADGAAEEAIDITQGKFDVFALSKREPLETDESFDIITKNDEQERFPLISVSESDPKNTHGASVDFIHLKTPAKPKKRAGVIIALATCGILLIFLLWTAIGIIYTNNYNEYVYEEFLNGNDVRFINSDFAFFLTLNETTLPVIKSDTPKHFRTFNGKFLSPGTLTSNGTEITGSPRLLPAFDESLIGKTLITENGSEKAVYEIYSVGEYSFQPPSEELVIYIEDNSSSTGYTALYAKKTASRLWCRIFVQSYKNYRESSIKKCVRHGINYDCKK